MAIDSLRLGNGRSFVILEKGRRVGGTWSDNEYPGCCCDVWSHFYRCPSVQIQAGRESILHNPKSNDTWPMWLASTMWSAISVSTQLSRDVLSILRLASGPQQRAKDRAGHRPFTRDLSFLQLANSTCHDTRTYQDLIVLRGK